MFKAYVLSSKLIYTPTNDYGSFVLDLIFIIFLKIFTYILTGNISSLSLSGFGMHIIFTE